MTHCATPAAAVSESANGSELLRRPSFARLAAALERSWVRRTAYLGASRPGNPAFGQCYPTARVVQWFFPETEIASGKVDTGSGIEAHFWNVERSAEGLIHIDLSWQQFPVGSRVTDFELLDRSALGDSPPTIARCRLLLERVLTVLAQEQVGEARIRASTALATRLASDSTSR